MPDPAPTPRSPDELLVTLDGRPAVLRVDHATPAGVVGTVVAGPGVGRVVLVRRGPAPGPGSPSGASGRPAG